MLSREQVKEIRKDFPYLSLDYKGGIVYFDNGATTQKPIQVIDALSDFYKFKNGNPHRSAHYLANRSTDIYESTRKLVADFIGAKSENEIIFTRNTTESLNLLTYSLGFNTLKEGDEILISIMEHHSNFVNWQQVAKKTGATLKIIYLDEDKQIDMEDFKNKVTENTKIFSITLASNVVGTIPKVKELGEYVKSINKDAVVIADAAQAAPHFNIDVKELGVDYLAFSGHKMLSALGIGVLYGREELLNSLSPFMYGGDMIEYVYEDRSSFLDSPGRFEAGTQNVGGAKSLGAAIKYMNSIGVDEIAEYERSLMDYAYDEMAKLDYINILTTSNKERSPVLTFNFKDIHPHDVASIMDSYGIAIRSGHHCAQPLHRNFGLYFSCRASFAFYNTFEEVDYFINHLEDVRRMMKI